MVKRRTHTKHRGVKEHWRDGVCKARWIDPDTGKEREQSLAALGLTTAEARREWMMKKSAAILARRAALASGAPLRTETDLGQAVKDYLAECKHRLKPNTVAAYGADLLRFSAWARSTGAHLTEEINGPRLAEYRVSIIAGRLHRSPRGERRGKKAATAHQVKPLTINTRLLHVKALLNHLRRLGRVPQLTSDVIRDALRPVSVPRPLPIALESPTLKLLLESTLLHDAKTFKITRDEHQGRRKVGTTARYTRVAPFVMTLLLTGMREAEARNLTWPDVRLDANGGHGAIRLAAGATKTARERSVDLVVSPALHRLLTTLKDQAGAGPFVFGGKEPWSRSFVESTRKRLIADFAAPAFTWQHLRSTCGSYLTNAPGIFGGAAAYRSARQLGHSVAVAEKHYLGVLSNLPKDATTLEDVMNVADLLGQVVARVSGGTSAQDSAPAA